VVPEEVRLETGAFALDRPLSVTVGHTQGRLLCSLIAEELRRAGLPEPKVPNPAGDENTLILSARAGEGLVPPASREGVSSEEYALRVASDVVVISGHGTAGLFYGVQTFCQLIRANRQGADLPCLTIRDWPSIRWRAFQDDLTRGPSSTLDTLKHEVATGAGLKMNLFTYYMEYE
jgi:hypothetical protein